MKIAVMSDIHGNYIALQRCLAHALEQNVDAYIFLGDYLGEFPYPQRTLEILYELKQNASCIFIRGNKEDYWLNRRKDQNCDWKSGNRSVMAMIYNYNSLNAKDLDFLKRCRSAKASGLPGWNRFWLVMERLLRIRKRCFRRNYSFKNAKNAISYADIPICRDSFLTGKRKS